ncbi:MAG TPA: hypothetical protein VGP04_17525, partial [Pseudonocardiaceae bacterium]|nr:hypothetical protein [Pseudonocardiaceae bacterium]
MTRWEATMHKPGAAVLQDPATGSQPLSGRSVIAGLAQGMSFRAGLGSLTHASPPDKRGEITSSYFMVLYTGTAIP